MVQQLYEAVRESCEAGTWTRAVALARRTQAVACESDAGATMAMRVRDAARPVARRVLLHVDDADWECECRAEEDVCEHVAAAAIVVHRARKRNMALPMATTAAGHVAHAFRRVDGGLALDRFVIRPGKEPARLQETLAAHVSGRASGPEVVPTQADLTVDRLVAGHGSGRLARDVLLDVVRALVDNAHLTLDAEPITASKDPLLPAAWIEDHGDGVRMVVDRNPDMDELVAAGLARVGGALHPLGETVMTGHHLEKLPLGRRFRPDELAELATQALPELEARLPVDIRTGRLPRAMRGEKPRLVMDVEQQRGLLSVMPLIVYGPGPNARVDGDKLVHLEGAVPVRDRAAEQDIAHRLRGELNLVPGRRVRYEGMDAQRFADALRAFQGRAAPMDRPLVRDATLSPRVGPGAGAENFDLSFEVEPDGPSATGEAVVRAWREGLGVVPLSDGTFAQLPADWLDTHGHLLADLVTARDTQGKLPRAALPQAARLCEALDTPTPFSVEGLEPLVHGFTELTPPELPDDLRAELRTYQKTGVAWMQFLARATLGGILADDMGLGKTVQALAALVGRTLVVCPASVVHNWSAETARFRPGLRVLVYHGARRELDSDADVVLTTYATMRRDIETLAAAEWGTVILDEAQAIKNPESQAARSAYRLEARLRMALTGTPVENRLDELWSLMHFASPGLLGGRSDFRDRYARPISDGDSEQAARLRQRIKPFVLRRLKRDVAPELPPRTEAVLHCELSREERAVYDAVRAATYEDVMAKLSAGGGVMAALEALLRMRQAACHTDLVPGQKADTSSKVERLLGALEEAAADGHKSLVFSQWTGLLDRVEPHLHAAQIPFVRLDGKTRDRQGVVETFQSAEGPPVMLVSLKAGGTGLNLTEADHVFLLDPWWNPAVEDQAADRAHRIGQTRPVMVYRLVAKDTVEEKVLALGKRKRALADAALGEATGAASLTRDDLLALFE